MAADPQAPAPADESGGLLRQVGSIVRAVVSSPYGRLLSFLAGGLVVVVGLTAYGQIRLNSWNKPFYDSLSRRDLHDFLVQLGVFFVIAAILLVLNVAQRWIVETLKYRLRQALVQDLIGYWMLPRRAFWLGHAGAMGVNPDQRMSEDAKKLCELTADLGVGLLQATILFCSFAGVLYGMSAGFSLRIGGVDHPVPGFMLWAAIAYAVLGSVLSWWVGRTLITRHADVYQKEGDLRVTLVRINEHLDGISLAKGEADERRRVEIDLGVVLASTARLVMGVTNLTWITAGFGWITAVAPTLVAAPLYFSGKISFGGLMMAAAAFTQAQSSLRWFVDNFNTIADWRATLLRVAQFRQALTSVDGARGTQHRIEYVEGDESAMTIEGLEVDSPSGRDMLQETSIVVRRGERVLIVGAPGTGKTLLFRALAGLYPWGSGKVVHPADSSILYMPGGTPYVPRGTLREALAYPRPVSEYPEERFVHALGRLGLERLVPLLDESRRWDRELSQDEQRSLSFARVVLHAPSWILIDDAIGALDEESLQRVADVLATDLAPAGVIHIGRAVHTRDPLFGRVFHLVKAPGTAGPAT